jgi:hypothetical protein
VQVRSLILPFLWLLFATSASGNYLSTAEQLEAAGAKFTWSEVESKSLKIVLEYQNGEGHWDRVNLGSGFIISPEGLFVTAYHVVQYCFRGQKEVSRFSESVGCSGAQLQYRALNSRREFEIEIISHLGEAESTNGKSFHTPDEIIKQRDFVIGKLKAPSGTRFAYWQLAEFKHDAIRIKNPRADFELRPLLPPKKVFVAGFPRDRDLEIAHGFLNLEDENNRGYFAADYPLYPPAYLEKEGIAVNTRWGMRIENHMSGGAVLDAAGALVGVVVNGNKNTAGILSIENVMETFFSRTGQPGAAPALILAPNAAPFFLRDQPADSKAFD